LIKISSLIDCDQPSFFRVRASLLPVYIVVSMESRSQRQARCHIETIARALTLDGAMHGSRIEALITSCLEM